MTQRVKPTPNRFWRSRNGATAVEFAIVGPIFIAIVVSIFELGMTMMKISLIDNAVSEVAKQIYIGAATNGNPSQQDLADFVCDEAIFIKDCSDNITVEVTTITDFQTPPDWEAPCVDSSNSEFQPTVNYNTGQGGEIVFLRVCVTTDIFTPGFGLGLSLVNTETNRMQIISSIAFMNEPF